MLNEYWQGVYLGLDWTYLVFILPAFIISLIAQVRVTSIYKKYSAIGNRRGMTGRDAAEAVLSDYGVTADITMTGGTLSDHYDPASNAISLSESVYGVNSIAAVGVAAHEAGHAVQYAVNYGPIKLRNAIIPITQISSYAALPIILLGVLLSFGVLVYVGIGLYSVAVLFQLLTLPVEINASRRAIRTIEAAGILDDEELVGAKKVLRAAALTYLAALLASFASLLRLLLIFGKRNR